MAFAGAFQHSEECLGFYTTDRPDCVALNLEVAHLGLPDLAFTASHEVRHAWQRDLLGDDGFNDPARTDELEMMPWRGRPVSPRTF